VRRNIQIKITQVKMKLNAKVKWPKGRTECRGNVGRRGREAEMKRSPER
jgi:hypothetical protein